MRVVVVGKGGSGKSLVSGTMARVLARRGQRVLALDSDPMPGLAINLGLGPLEDEMLTDAAEKDESGRWRLKKGIGAARAVQRYSAVAPDGVRLLQFGKAGDQGFVPFMGSLNAFHQVLYRIARDDVLRDWTIIGDHPAGPRQTAFGWAPYADTFLMIVEPTWQSVLTARRIGRIARAKKQGEVLVVANKIRGEQDLRRVEERMGGSAFAVVPADPAVRSADVAGEALLDHAPGCPAIRAVEKLVDRLERRTLDLSETTKSG
nr:hypothetical protein [Actinomycetota bacterium]